jgi:hypothetical protein
MAKLISHSPRPFWVDTRIHPFASGGGFGLPSGHSQSAASIWGLLAVNAKQVWVKITMLVIIFMIGLSRLFLGVHYPRDVLTGWTLGLLLLFVFVKSEKLITNWMAKRKFYNRILIYFLLSVLLFTIPYAISTANAAWDMPDIWIENASRGLDDSPLDPFNPEWGFTVAGTCFGLLAGYDILKKKIPSYSAKGSLNHRLLRYPVGVMGILLFWYGLGFVFPDSADAISYSLRYFRYALVGIWVSYLAPLTFIKLGLVKPKS